MSEERVTEALSALRRADAGVTIAPEAEIRTLLKFRRQRRQRRLQRIAMLSATAAAALVLAIPPWRARQHPAPAVAIAVPSATPDPTGIAVPVAVPQMPVKQVASNPEEITTDFFPLMVSAPPFERGLLVRVTVTAEAMRAVGLPVDDEHLSDPVDADVLVGQDDLARAIRFVSYRN